jgi:hypothetical protein
VLRTEGIEPLYSELFPLLSCGGLVAVDDESGKSRYGIIRLLLDDVGYRAHGLGLTSEKQRGNSTEEESVKVQLNFAKLRSALPPERGACL